MYISKSVYNINNIILNFKLLVEFSQAKNDKNLTCYIWASLAIISNLILIKAVFRFLIFIIFNNYKLNIFKVLEYIFYFSFMLIREKKVI